ncbi:hypothetical protein TNIN_409951 [Trichonephila inaurata madagascariensis]|uniref:CCHC-type domain-containing protein n=1 Tax=Trichonephila inaurata madagascariensis TaxID=2747483 RepID=A0A8X7BV39_9ARAC|nr:hypothetical protein TNIN_409951 [Trichonephila inaurata madagascariensis]
MSKKSCKDRKSEVMHWRCCLVCLKYGHMAKKCHSSVKCLICGRRHYVLLHPDVRKENPISPKDTLYTMSRRKPHGSHQI